MPRQSEADARIAIDDQPRQSGRDPLDKSMVGAEVRTMDTSAVDAVVDRSRARPFATHAPPFDLVASAGAFGPDRTVGEARDELGWVEVLAIERAITAGLEKVLEEVEP